MINWQDDARAAIESAARERRESAARKQAAFIERASKSRTSVGRFLRTRYGRDLASSKREVRYISIPIDLDQDICAEAADVGLSISRYLLTLVALGAAQWPYYRTLISGGAEPVPVPKLVECILENAVNPPAKKPAPDRLSAWQRAVHEAITKQSRPGRAVDPTEAVMRGVAGG